MVIPAVTGAARDPHGARADILQRRPRAWQRAFRSTGLATSWAEPCEPRLGRLERGRACHPCEPRSLRIARSSRRRRALGLLPMASGCAGPRAFSPVSCRAVRVRAVPANRVSPLPTPGGAGPVHAALGPAIAIAIAIMAAIAIAIAIAVMATSCLAMACRDSGHHPCRTAANGSLLGPR